MKTRLKIIDLLARNTETKFTINGIAKNLKAYYSFVYRTVDNLAKENVIIKIKLGKSYICSLNLENEKSVTMIKLSEIERREELYAENRELKLLLEDFIKAVETSVPVLSMILFGSYAKSTARKDSDIDIMLIVKRKVGIENITKEIYAKYGKETNALLITPKEFKAQMNKPIIKDIISSHYILYGVEDFVNLVFRK